MGHAEVVDDAAVVAEPGDAGPGHVGPAGHHRVLGEREQQRAAVGVAVAQQRLDLEGGPARVGGVDGERVVDDVLEHAQGPDPHHQPQLPGPPLNGPTTFDVTQPP